MKCPICNDSLVPVKLSPGTVTHEHQTGCAFAWNDLTVPQIEVLRDAALGAAVQKEITKLEHKREHNFMLSDLEDSWLNDLQTLVVEARLMKGEEE